MTVNAGSTRRNLGAAGASLVTVGVLMLYPTSTNSSVNHRRPGQALAPVGVVSVPKAVRAVTTTLVNGSSVDTPYGLVQVQVAVRGGRIVRATAIDYPRGTARAVEINSQAIPVLERETVRAQSAAIDTVSGATFTSDGYRTSLQAALDLAHLR